MDHYKNLPHTRTTGKTMIPTTVDVHIGMDSLSTSGIEVCSTQLQYIEFTVPSLAHRQRKSMLNECEVSPRTVKFKWYVAANGSTPNMILRQAVFL